RAGGDVRRGGRPLRAEAGDRAPGQCARGEAHVARIARARARAMPRRRGAGTGRVLGVARRRRGHARIRPEAPCAIWSGSTRCGVAAVRVAMAGANGYCDVAPGHPEHGPYHDREYGFPLAGDAELLERLALEINQAGLSWLTILKKREAFHRAYRGFDPEVVARFGARDRARLLAAAAIIRNGLKVDAVIANAKTVLALRKEYGSFKGWLDAHHPLDK